MTRKITRNSHKKTGAGEVVTGLLVGSIVGDTLGLWFAPASAEETIRTIKDEVRDIQNKAKKAVGNFEDKYRDPATNVTGAVNEINENE